MTEEDEAEAEKTLVWDLASVTYSATLEIPNLS